MFLKSLTAWMLTATMGLVASIATADPYEINYDKSYIEFSGTHAGRPFTGKFKDFIAEINFDHNNLKASNITTIIRAHSAKTGDPLYDKTLPKDEWFATDKFENPTFHSTSITKTGQGYTVTGNLTIREITKEVQFYFTMDSNRQDTEANAEFSINRLDYGIGAVPDPNGQWVSPEIGMKLKIVARKK